MRSRSSRDSDRRYVTDQGIQSCSGVLSTASAYEEGAVLFLKLASAFLKGGGLAFMG